MTFLDLQLRICIIGYVLLVLVLVKQLLSFNKLRHRSHFALNLKQPRRFSGARCCSRGLLLRISLIFLVLRKAGLMDPTGKIFLRDGESWIKFLCFLIIFQSSHLLLFIFFCLFSLWFFKEVTFCIHWILFSKASSLASRHRSHNYIYRHRWRSYHSQRRTWKVKTE